MVKDKFDLFISYSTTNADVANFVVDRIEARGYKCFIAPRDIALGHDYAQEIINAISNSTAVLLVFSEEANRSGYVLREINSAVSRNKTIIPLRIENFIPSQAMEFYLGVTQWLDAYPQILDVHLDNVIAILNGIQNQNAQSKQVTFLEPQLVCIDDALNAGFSQKDIITREIELDYICITKDKFNMNDEIEGTFDDWSSALEEYEKDTSVLMVANDEIIGYCDFYPVNDEAYVDLISGKSIIRDNMIELYEFGGDFNAYIAMIVIAPQYASQKTYMMFVDWVLAHICDWKERDINLKNIGISIYSDMLEKFVVKLGFVYKGTNPAKGKIYEISCEDLLNNPLAKKRLAQ